MKKDKMTRYLKTINSMNVLDLLEGRITIEQLKDKFLSIFYSMSKNEQERKVGFDYVESLFSFTKPFLESLTLEEYDAISKYGRKIGAVSYEINNSLRKDLSLSNEAYEIVKHLDSAMEKFNLNDELVVYRALKPDFLKESETVIGTQLFDPGYMSTSW